MLLTNSRYLLVTVLITSGLVGFFNRQIVCNINGLVINKEIVGTPREVILDKLGAPRNSDLGIKSFDDYSYSLDGKNFAVLIRYKESAGKYQVSSSQCLKSQPKLILFNRVIWH